MRADQIQLEYQMKFSSPFHFGTGFRRGLIHRTVNRDANGYLFVPGSTLKGALRERCEHLAQLFNLHTHEPHGETSALNEFSPSADIVDRIFGSRFRPGTLYFDDAIMVQEDRELFDGAQGTPKYLDQQIQQRTQVGMSRLTRTAKQGFLYTSEFGIQQLRFKGQIYGQLCGFDFPGEQDGTYALVLLLAGLHSLDRLGGSKSSGAGQLTCEIAVLEVNGESQPPTGHFAHLEDLELYWVAREEENHEG